MTGTAPANGLRLGVSRLLENAATLEAEPGYTPTAAEAAMIARLDAFHAELARNAPPPTHELFADHGAARERCLRRLRACVDRVLAAPPGAERDAIAQAELLRTHSIQGFHEFWLVRIGLIPFVVDLLANGKVVKADEATLVDDVRIAVRNVRIPPERQRLKAEIDRAATVVKTVLLERARKDESTWEMALGRQRRRDAAQRLDHHMRRLAGIARVGLMNTDATQTAFAELSLASFREEFVALEASQVKNTYVTRLGFWALLGLLLSVAGWMLAGNAATGSVPAAFRNFFLLAAGASLGTWLSFSLRRVTLGFADLALLEEDRLNPGLRVMFVVALTSVVGLLIWTEAVTFGVGEFRADIRQSGSDAALLGVLAGIAERAVATAVGGRAQDFGTALGGGATKRV